jgi:acyl carrier protein
LTGSAPEPVAGAGMAEPLEDVKRTLRRLIEENAGIPADSISDESSIDGDLAMDSFSFVSLQVAVEETFDVSCAPEEIEARNDFNGIARLILEKSSGEPARKPALIPLDEHRRNPSRRN